MSRSCLSDKKGLIVIGEVVRTQGIGGKLKVKPLAEPDTLTSNEGVYLGKSEDTTLFYRVLASQFHNGFILLSLEGIDSMERAEELVGNRVFADKRTLEKLPEGDYYWFEIIGLKVATEDGRPLGKVEEIIPTGSNDVYVVRDSKNEYLIPAISEVIKEIDVAGGRMVISPIKGLLGEE